MDKTKAGNDKQGNERLRYNNNDRNNSDRVRFSNNDRNNSDRPRYNNAGDRNNSERPRYNNTGDKNNSDRPRYNNAGDRNSSERPRYNNAGDRNGQDRGRFSNNSRGGQDRGRFTGNGERQGGYEKPKFGGDRTDNRNNRFNNRNNTPMGFGKDDDEENTNQRRNTRSSRKDYDAKDLPGKDLKSQNRDNYNRDKNKPRKGNRRSPEEVEADISRLAKNVRNKHHQPQAHAEETETIRTITLPEVVTIKELADIIKEPVNALIKKLFLAGKMYNVNSELDFETASEIALEYNCIAEEEEKG